MGKTGFVYLIGAGPGDSGLITVKGMNALQKADVILYDNLVAVSLLNEIKSDAQLVYTGKRSGQHSMKQEEISALIVKKANEGFIVVRLKGGDPFIFGRGGEEVLELKKYNIPFEIIPGISSSYAVPAYAGVPVTHRGLASSFHVITGHEDGAKEKSALNYSILAHTEGTLVFLMGLKNLANIVENLIANGKSKDTKAAVIEKGTTSGQRIVSGTLESIVDQAREKNIQTPAITVVGEVVGLHNAVRWFGQKPLSNKSVLITATDEISEKISEKIAYLGGEPLDISLIHAVPANGNMIAKVLNDIHTFTWIILTSRNGVHIFFEQLKRMQLDIRKLSGIRFAVIGHGTQETLMQYGIYADFVPTIYTSACLGRELAAILNKNDRLLLARAASGSSVLPHILDEANIDYVDVPIYETQIDTRKKELLQRTYKDADYITFCSPSAVDAFVKLLDKVDISLNVADKIICIGPVTAKAVKDAGLPVYKTAKVYDADGLVSCILSDGGEKLWN